MSLLDILPLYFRFNSIPKKNYLLTKRSGPNGLVSFKILSDLFNTSVTYFLEVGVFILEY
jgi:hypothetical protein